MAVFFRPAPHKGAEGTTPLPKLYKRVPTARPRVYTSVFVALSVIGESRGKVEGKAEGGGTGGGCTCVCIGGRGMENRTPGT